MQPMLSEDPDFVPPKGEGDIGADDPLPDEDELDDEED